MATKKYVPVLQLRNSNPSYMLKIIEYMLSTKRYIRKFITALFHNVQIENNAIAYL